MFRNKLQLQLKVLQLLRDHGCEMEAFIIVDQGNIVHQTTWCHALESSDGHTRRF